MNPALCSSGFLGILGLYRFYEGLMWNYVVYSKKCMFPVFFNGEPQNSCRGSSFSSRISENGEPDSGFALLGVFLRQMIAIEIILHIVYSKNIGIYSGFWHVPQFERWRCRYICNAPPPGGRPWEGGWPYIYTDIWFWKYHLFILNIWSFDLDKF